MKKNQDYKNAALAALKGNWAPAVVSTIVLFAMSFLIMIPALLEGGQVADHIVSSYIVNLTVILFFPVLIYYPICMVGYTNAFKQLLVEGDSKVTRNMFSNTFKGYWNNALGVVLMILFVYLWMLLFIIPGIIKGFAYSMTPYILKDNPELSANQAINLSVKMMKGHKFDLLCLCLSFIGWGLLSILTLGIGYFWLMPYMYTSMAAFYQDVKNDYLTKNN